MNEQPQLLEPREVFFRRERRSVPLARDFTAEAVHAWGFLSRRDDVLLCVSELVTNALLHGVPPGRGLRLYLYACANHVLRVEVHDSGPGADRIKIPTGNVDDDWGRGLFLVSRLADTWGVSERNPGKIVWCEFREAGEA